MSRRTDRVASIIQQELAMIILRELNDPRITGMPSVTRVKVSADLGIADVFMTVMGTQGQQNAALNALRHSAGMMRTRLTKALTLRTAPFLKFHLDENLKREIAVLDLIRKASQEAEENERKRAGEAGPASEEDSMPQAGSAPESGPVPESDSIPQSSSVPQRDPTTESGSAPAPTE
jgi:ribosome-binding factor A